MSTLSFIYLYLRSSSILFFVMHHRY